MGIQKQQHIVHCTDEEFAMITAMRDMSRLDRESLLDLAIKRAKAQIKRMPKLQLIFSRRTGAVSSPVSIDSGLCGIENKVAPL